MMSDFLIVFIVFLVSANIGLAMYSIKSHFFKERLNRCLFRKLNHIEIERTTYKLKSYEKIREIAKTEEEYYQQKRFYAVRESIINEKLELLCDIIKRVRDIDTWI